MSMPISRITSTANGFNCFGSTPALRGSNSSPATCRRYPSAIWLLAELPVQRNSTFGLDIGVLLCGCAAARCATRCSFLRLLFREIVNEHHEDFPFITVGITDPSLVLRCIAAVGVHLVSGVETHIGPLLPHRQNVDS